MRYQAFALGLLAACGVDSGTLTATVYGEEFIEEGIPAEEFSDGWSVSFDKFLVSIGNVAGKAGEGGDEVGDTSFHIVDLAQASNGDGFELASFDAPGGDYDHYGYQLRSDAGATALNAEAADVTAMKAAGYAIWVQGSATNGAESKTFDWGFTATYTFAHCDLGASIDGNALVAQATIHADHLFYDDAVSDEPNVAFQLLADADGAAGSPPDGAITLDELAAVDIRGETRYQVGSNTDLAGNTITNLRQYVELQSKTVGHINGEGHCEEQLAQP
ncbi:MAG TPA: hypothetical protein VM513_16300 [Kofleriaceae bacterium]|nr:hypothetical protein [Kofleriaceae bacterium]